MKAEGERRINMAEGRAEGERRIVGWSESGRPLPPFGFHSRDGWHFRREPDGSVAIIATTEDGETATAWGVLDANTWASVVASVCERGETGDTFRAAVALHG